MQSLKTKIASSVEPKKKSLLNSYAAPKQKPKTVDDWLNAVDYGYLNSGKYQPTIFALKVISFIKLVNELKVTNGDVDADDADYLPNPIVHLVMLDKLVSKKQQIANLCSRGLGKTAVMFRYLALYLAIFHHIDGFGNLDGMLYISDTMDNGAKTARQSLETEWNNSAFLQEELPEAIFTERYIQFTNKDGKKFGIKLYGASGGVRGTQIFGKRPKLAVLDDLVSDEVAESETKMRRIRNVVNRGIKHSLNRRQRKIIFNGTPFNKSDPMYMAVESGAWEVNVWPAAEKFPCSKEEFNSAWPEIYTYENMMSDYMDGENSPEIRISFNQELMLRISSVDERLIRPEDKKWYSRKKLLEQKHKYNFFITTDFAVKTNEKGDYTCIMVWAVNSKGKWYLIDGILKRQGMLDNIKKVFKWVKKYNVLSVGIETSGQQGSFLEWFYDQMRQKGEYFVLATAKGTNKTGIYPPASKFTRFNMVVPWFKADLMRFPIELKTSDFMLELMDEIDNATINGLKSRKDDGLDGISMLVYMNTWNPTQMDKMRDNQTKQEVSPIQIFHSKLKAENHIGSCIENYL